MMPRSPFQDENGLKKGPWTTEEDRKLVEYIEKHGHGSWRALPKLAGLNRCGKSCRLRWTNYLRPDIKRGKFSDEEEHIIVNLHSTLGNKWSMIASHLPGRTDNEIKNFWNTHLKKKLLQMGIDPVTHMPRTDFNIFPNLQHLGFPWESSLRLQSDATQLAKIQLLQNILQVLSSTSSNTEAFYNLVGRQPISEVEGFANAPTANSAQFPINFQNCESSQQPLACDHEFQKAMDGLKSCTELGNDSDNRVCNFYDVIPSSNTVLPSLVSVSPECSNKIDGGRTMENKSGAISTAIEENWADLDDDETTESYWKDVISQRSPQEWTIP